MAVSEKLPPRVFELFHFLFFQFLKELRFLESHVKTLSITCFVIACKVRLTSSRARTSTSRTPSAAATTT